MNKLIFISILFQYTKFIFGGGLALLINLAVTYYLTEYFNIWHIYSYGVIQILELIFLYIYHSIVTFKIYAKFIKFFIVILFIAFINWLFVLILTIQTNLDYLFIIILVTAVISIINFSLNKIYVFKSIKNSR